MFATANKDSRLLNVRQWILIQKNGKNAYWLDEEIVTSIGREGCNINIQSPTVNREHAVLWFDPDSSFFYLKDLDTDSGTFINGVKMNSSISTKLKNNDLLRFGFARPTAHSNMYQIRSEATVSRGPTVEETQGRRDMDLNLTKESSRSWERNDSGHCSSSSPCSPQKPGPFPTGSRSNIPTSTDARNLQGDQSSNVTEEDVFSNKYSPMAFTVDFGPSVTKTLDLSASISKYAPTRHHRTGSSSKADKRAGSEGGESGNSRRNQTPSTNSESDFGKTKEKERFVSSSSKSGTVLNPHPTFKLKGTTTSKTQRDEDDRKSETGTYTVELDTLEQVTKDEGIFRREEGIESPLDSSLEWVREWAERASTQIKQNPTPPPSHSQRSFVAGNDHVFLDHEALLDSEVRHYPSRNSSLQRKKLNRNSWHESYSDDQHARLEQLSARSSPKPSPNRRVGREASAVSDYSAYRRSQPVQNQARLSYAPSYNASATKIPSHKQQVRERLSSDYCSPAAGTPNSGDGTAGTSPNSNYSSSSFSRLDGGRFSLRSSKQSEQNGLPEQVEQTAAPTQWNPLSRLAQPRSVATVAPNAKLQTQTIPAARKPHEKTALSRKPLLGSGKRANSTLTAKEVELANWNRRKSYDPRKAAALGKNKGKQTPPPIEVSSDEPGQRNNPDGAASITKSPSFHNGAEYRLESSTEELGIASEEEFDDGLRTGSLTRMRCRFEDTQYHHHPSSPQRQKHKFEALDCLVISTIHTLSNKVRTSARNLLEKIQVHSVDDENGALVDEMISQLKDLEVNASPQKGPSRELSGTLKNMKKLEQVILVLDRILCSETDDL